MEYLNGDTNSKRDEGEHRYAGGDADTVISSVITRKEEGDADENGD